MKSIILPAIILISIFTLHHVSGASLDDTCDPNVDPDECDGAQFLECDPDLSVCVCQNKDNAYFDSSDNICHLLVGTEGCSSDPSFQPCPRHGWCDEFADPVACACKTAEAEETQEKKCALPYQTVCVDDSDCNPDHYMTCIEEGGGSRVKKCGCDPASSFYDGTGCAIKLHQPCTGDTGAQICGAGSECKDLTCQCLPDLVDNGNECQAGYGLACDAQIKCDEVNLECGPKGWCVCKNSDTTWYDKAAKACKLRSGIACTPGGPTECYPNSFCNPDGICQCEGYTHPNREGLCFLEAGQICTPTPGKDQCDATEFHHCDLVSLKCGCLITDDIVQESQSTCRIKADSVCTVGADVQPCTSHADCTGPDPLKCQCSSGLVRSEVGKCVRSHGTECGEALPGGCDAEAFQSCNGGVCRCMDDTTMVYDGSKCGIKVKNPCNEQSIVKCTEHAICTEDVCACETGFHADLTVGTCVPNPLHPLWTVRKY